MISTRKRFTELQLLKELPHELLHNVLMSLDIQDLARYSATANHLAESAEAALRHKALNFAKKANFAYIHHDQIEHTHTSMASYLAWYEYIILKINDPNWRVRMKGLQILSALAPAKLSQEQFTEAISHLLKDEKAKVRRRALQTMQNFNTDVLENYAHAVADMIDDKEKYVRITAHQTLNYIDPRFIDSHTKYATWLQTFIRRINSGAHAPGNAHEDERMLALRELIADVGPLVQDQPQPAYVHNVVDILHHHAEIDVKWWALATMDRLGQVAVENHALEVVNTLQVPGLRRIALRAMQKLSSGTLAHHTAAIIGFGILNDEDPDVRKEALKILQHLEPAALNEHAPNFILTVNDTDRDVRITALQTLRKLEPATLAQHVPNFIHMLNEEDELVRKETLVTLTTLEQAVLKMYTIDVVNMLKDNAASVCEQALKTLCEIGDEETTLIYYTDDIVENLKNPFDHVQKTALKVLHRAGPAEMEKHAGDVVEMLNFCSPDVRNMALIFLSRCRDTVHKKYTDIFNDRQNRKVVKSLKKEGILYFQ